MRRCTLALFAMASLAVPLSAVSAQGSSVLVVNAHRAALGDNQLAVPYSDLALSGAGGQRMLLQRVSFAIDSLCDGMHVTAPVDAVKCSNGAWDSVRPQLQALSVTR